MINNLSDYILLEKISCGNFSCVWKAKHKLLDNYCAIKIVDFGKNEKSYDRYIEECAVLSRLKHQNLCSIFDSRILDVNISNSLFPWKSKLQKIGLIIMPFFEGQTLKELDITNLDKSKILSIFYDIVSGVEYLHSKEIVHNDISLTNIIVNKDNPSVIIDMGMSKNINVKRCQCCSSVSGTLDWASPEFLASGHNKYTNDIYAIGSIIYFLLTGKKIYGNVKDIDFLIRTKKMYCINNIDLETNSNDIVQLIKYMVSPEKYRIQDIKIVKSYLKNIIIQHSFFKNLMAY